jgi:hypothetical protein
MTVLERSPSFAIDLDINPLAKHHQGQGSGQCRWPRQRDQVQNGEADCIG